MINWINTNLEHICVVLLMIPLASTATFFTGTVLDFQLSKYWGWYEKWSQAVEFKRTDERFLAWCAVYLGSLSIIIPIVVILSYIYVKDMSLYDFFTYPWRELPPS